MGPAQCSRLEAGNVIYGLQCNCIDLCTHQYRRLQSKNDSEPNSVTYVIVNLRLYRIFIRYDKFNYNGITK